MARTGVVRHRAPLPGYWQLVGEGILRMVVGGAIHGFLGGMEASLLHSAMGYRSPTHFEEEKIEELNVAQGQRVCSTGGIPSL